MHLQELELEIALDYWSIVLVGKFHYLDQWIEFYHPKRHNRFVSRETWILVLEFAVTVRNDLGEHNTTHDGQG